MDIKYYLFEIIQVAIGNRNCLSSTLTGEEWKALSILVERQALTGICSIALGKLKCHNQCPPDEVYWHMIGTATMIIRRNEQIDKRCIKLQESLKIDGFRSSILKGQGIALYYPAELVKLRQPGDIDIWVDAPREEVMDYVMKFCPTHEFDAKHIHCHIFKDVEVEMHCVPSYSYIPKKNRILKMFFSEQADAQMRNEMVMQEESNVIITPNASFNAVYLLLHMHGHFLYEGIGMKQMMDYYYVLLVTKNKDLVLSIIKKLKIYYFLSSVMYVMTEVFGINSKYLLCPPDKKGGELLLQEILRGGNLGVYSRENQIIQESKIHYIARRLNRRIRLFRYEPIGFIYRPIFRIRLELWKRKMYKKYDI